MNQQHVDATHRWAPECAPGRLRILDTCPICGLPAPLRPSSNREIAAYCKCGTKHTHRNAALLPCALSLYFSLYVCTMV